MKRKNHTALMFSALFAALISAGSFIQIPLPGGVPVAVQDMIAILSGLLLGPVYGTVAVALFLFLGCIGLPVFTGKAGLHIIIAGPTGGFLAGYLFAAFAGGLILHFVMRTKKSPPVDGARHVPGVVRILVAATVAMAVIFIAGLGGFMRITGRTLAESATLAVVPFIPGTVAKLIIIIPLVKKFRPVIAGYMG